MEKNKKTLKRVLILSPHTDDAELGCGGYISKLVREKHEILWVVFSTAEDSLPKHLPKNTLKREFFNVVRHIKINKSNTLVFNYKVRHLYKYRQDILEELVKLKKTFLPNLVIGPSLNDYHQDHQIVANEMIRAFKSSASIISYELPWNHLNFNTQMFVSLSDIDIKNKIKMLHFYNSQLSMKRHYFSDDFIIGLARVRGAQIGKEYAEAFEVIRWLEPY